MASPPTDTIFGAAVAKFVSHQRAFGRSYAVQEFVLTAIARYVSQQGTSDLSAPLYHRWCKAQQHLSSTSLHESQILLRKFCLFRRRSTPRCFVPDATTFARRRPPRAPVIVTPAQVASLLQAAKILSPSIHNPLRAATTRIAIVLLYTAGLRRGELARMQLRDVDAEEGLLYVRESKFHRSRWVPLSNGAKRELQAYLRQRLRKPFERDPATPLLCNGNRSYGRSGWHNYCGAGLAQGLRELIQQTNVRGADGRYPTVHDFRHSFAVEALARWYRNGEDVQAHLPRLALYMGHVSIVSTAYYLHFIPEVAALASNRFGKRYSHLLEGDGS